MAYFSGRIIQKELAKAIGKSIKIINDFKKVAKSPYHEAQALMFLLDIVFVNYTSELGTCFTIFDSKLAIITKRFINLVVKLHLDYHVEFSKKVDEYTQKLAKHCSHLDTVQNMPTSFIDAIESFKD